MSSTSSPPPKFQGSGNIIGPTSPSEWADFYRWLFAQWKQVQTAVSLQSLTLAGFPAIPEGSAQPIDPSIFGSFPGIEAHIEAHVSHETSQSKFPAAPYASRRPVEIVVCTQATFPTLTSGSIPFLIVVTDYQHTIFWNGTAAAFVDGGNCYIALFDIDPGAGWHLLDGTASVPYLNADGTLSTYTVEDATTAFFLEAGLSNSGPTAAVAPTFTGTPATPAGTVSAPVFSGTPKTWDVVNVVSVSGTQSVLTGDATNNPYTPAGTISAPTFTGTPATPAGTISTTGEPRKLVRRPFFRQ